MRTSIISLGLAVIIGIVIGLLLQSPGIVSNPTAPPSKTDNTLLHMDSLNAAADIENNNTGIDAIRQQLAQEITARKKLQSTVNNLSKKFAQLETEKLSNKDDTKTTSPHDASTTNTKNRNWFNQQALIDAGMDATTAGDLKARYETQELDKLYLRDRAMREGWFGNRRYREEMEKLDAQFSDLQKELGDESYSAYLYATGQSNRVTVQSVLANSSADTAGLRATDQILRYGEQPIYNWRDLRTATTQGDINESVTIEIIRDGKPMQLYVQRGPLGIRMNSASVAP